MLTMNGAHQKVYHSTYRKTNLQKVVSVYCLHNCSSGDEQFPGSWLLKKYNDNAKQELLCIGMTEEEHERKQVQMHNLAKSIAEQMARKLGKTCGEIFSYNSAFLGKMLNDTDGSSENVTIEKFIEGLSFVKYMNNTGDIDRELPTTAVEKAEALAHFQGSIKCASARAGKFSICAGTIFG